MTGMVIRQDGLGGKAQRRAGVRVVGDRLIGLVACGVAVLYWLDTISMDRVPSDDPVGPAGLPRLLAGVAGLLGVWLCIGPRSHGDERPGSGQEWVAWIVLVAYTLMMPLVGYAVGTGLFLFLTFRLFGRGWLHSAASSVLVTLTLYGLFAALGLRLS